MLFRSNRDSFHMENVMSDIRQTIKNTTYNATRDVTWNATYNATRDVTWNATCNATRDVTWNATWNATRIAIDKELADVLC